MKALVVGFGSIGARHARILTELGHDVAIVSRHAAADRPLFRNLDDAQLTYRPDYVVIANDTADHEATLTTLISRGFAGDVLVEKPLFSNSKALGSMPFASCHVAYNLRFHPLIEAMHAALSGERSLSVMCYAGQYLPDWRPGTDYRTSYSSDAARGGGVLRDLSHELDYLSMMFGPWQKVAALGGHFSDLDGDSDDIFALQLAYRDCPIAQVQLNYLDRPGRRALVVNTARHTFELDFRSSTLRKDGEAQKIEAERDTSYRALHQSILAREARACTVDEGMDTLDLIVAAERAAQTGVIQCRG